MTTKSPESQRRQGNISTAALVIFCSQVNDSLIIIYNNNYSYMIACTFRRTPM